MGAEIESARSEWAEAHRRLLEEMREQARTERLAGQLDVVARELRKRVGGSYTLAELASEYRHAERWASEALGQQAQPGWPQALTMVQGAAFHLASLGAVDYEP